MGECKVSGGESKMSRRVGLPRNPHAPRSKFPKWPSIFFGGLLGDSCCVAMVEPLVSHLESTVPSRCLRDGYCVWVCPLCLFCFVVSHLFEYGLLPALLPPPHYPMAKRKKVAGDELSARAKANGYQRGVHRDKDSLRDQNKHVDRVKMHQNAALDRYIL